MVRIFSSYLTLTFQDNQLEKEYINESKRGLRERNIIYLYILILLSVLNNLLYSLQYKNAKFDILEYNRLTSYIVTALHVIELIACFIITNLNIQKYIAYISYFLLLFTNYIISYLFDDVYKETLLFTFIYKIIELFRLTWMFTRTLDFKEALYYM
jgi:hypothetical protein